MLKIGKIGTERMDGFTRLCSVIRIGDKAQQLWYGVPTEQESALSVGRADPFVLALLPTALRQGLDISSEDPLSERLHFQLRNDLIPALVQTEGPYHCVSLHTPLTDIPLPSQNAVATGFSGGVDSLYTIYRHGQDCEYPLTHLAVFNCGIYEGKNYRQTFLDACRRCGEFAREQKLKTVFVDSNLYEVLPERYLDVGTFRLLSCALAVQGLVSIYLLSSGYPFEQFSLDVHNTACFDPLSVNCVSTESLQVYLSGAETDRVKKWEALSGWEPSFRWISPCIFEQPGELNCGHCKKCVRDLAILYALNRLDNYRAVFDIQDYQKHLPQRLGFVLANRKDPICRDAVALLSSKKAYIPPLAHTCGALFRQVIEKKCGEEKENG